MKRSGILIGLLLIILVSTGYSQAPSAKKKEFLRGKAMYQEGRYNLAMEILKPLTLPSNESVYSPYAAYYYSLSALQEGYSYLAEDMLRHLLDQYPDWGQADLARLWLVKILLLEEEYSKSIVSIRDFSNDTLRNRAEELLKNTLSEIRELDTLKSIYRTNPDQKPVAQVLADKIYSMPLIEQDRELLRSIVVKFEMDLEKYGIIDELTSIHKEEYNIAVLFPFMIEDIVPNQVKRNNQFILDIFDGLEVAAEDLRKKGIKLNIYPFDTRRDSTHTRKIIDSGDLEGFDLIIGPLYPGPVKVVFEYSLENRINMFNPLSTNSDLIRNNPFCFLFKPTSERQALEVKEYTAPRFKNKNVFIFYDDAERDSISAFTYKKAMEEDSFNILLCREITTEDTTSIYKILTRKVKFEEAALTGEDSIRIIDRHDLYDYFEKLKKAQKNPEMDKPKPLEIFVIAPDSISHVFVATRDELLAAQTISGIETRQDSTVIIGEESWINFNSISLEQMERLDVLLIAPGFVDEEKPFVKELNQKIIDKLNTPSTIYHQIGYELTNFLGEMMNEHGVYFQTGFRNMEVFPGLMFQGFDYSEGNDNAVVPLISFTDSEFIVINQY